MKIKISPSLIEPEYISVEMDTLTNEDGTPECVELCMKALIAIGHDELNVAEACDQWATERKALARSRHET